MEIRPFEISVSDEVLDDLNNRLSSTRWPDELPGTAWDYGSNLDYMKELAGYWQTGFDWRAQERLINSFRHFKADVDGLGIHFIHERGKGPDPMPLVITHGWPGSFFEMYKIIPLLTDPASHGGDPERLVRCGGPVAARFRILRPRPGTGHGGAEDRLSLGGIDERTRLPALCSARRRYRRGCDLAAGTRPRRQHDRHPPDLGHKAHAVPGARC